MQPFSLTLSNGTVISGLVTIPSPPLIDTHRPLLVFLHGGSYAADYFDADAGKSVEPLCKSFNIPVVSLNRQGYKESTHLPTLSEGQTNHGEQAKALNEFILPRIWTEYGVPSGASSIVLAGHSVGAMLATMTAAFHATAAASNTYPLSGLCTTGLAKVANPYFKTAGVPQPPTDETGRFIHWPDAARDGMMLMLHEGKADPDFSETHAKLNNPAPIDEVRESMNMESDAAYKVAAKNVQVPVLALVGEHDALWDMSKAALNEYVDLFEQTTVELGVVQNGPHCLELSYQGKAVFAKVLGHALQSAVGYGLEKEKSSKV